MRSCAWPVFVLFCVFFFSVEDRATDGLVPVLNFFLGLSLDRILGWNLCFFFSFMHASSISPCVAIAKAINFCCCCNLYS